MTDAVQSMVTNITDQHAEENEDTDGRMEGDKEDGTTKRASSGSKKAQKTETKIHAAARAKSEAIRKRTHGLRELLGRSLVVWGMPSWLPLTRAQSLVNAAVRLQVSHLNLLCVFRSAFFFVLMDLSNDRQMEKDSLCFTHEFASRRVCPTFFKFVWWCSPEN